MTDDPSGAVVGLDLGKRRIAIAWPAWQTARSFDLGKPGIRHMELTQLGDWVRSQLTEYHQLWIESPYVSNGAARNQTTSLDMAETLGVIKAAWPWKVEPVMVVQSTWKAQVVGNGRADKDEVAAWLAENHPELYRACSTEDERDAMCIGIYGQGRVSGEILPPVSRPKRRATKR